MHQSMRLKCEPSSEPLHISDDIENRRQEKAEWFHEWTKDYTPGEAGSPGPHEGTQWPVSTQNPEPET